MFSLCFYFSIFIFFMLAGIFIKFIEIYRSQTNSSRDIVSPWIETGTTVTGQVVCSSCNRNHNEGSDVSDTSAPLISRTPSSICPASPTHQDVMLDNPDWLDDVDGLPVICCDVQMRVQQIIVEHKVLEAAVFGVLSHSARKFSENIAGDILQNENDLLSEDL